MSGEAVPQSVRMNLISQTGAGSSLAASSPDHLTCNGFVTSVPAVAGKQPDVRFPPQSAHITPKLLQEFRTEHDIAVFAALSSFDMNHHPFTINVRHFQLSELGASQASRI